MTTCTIRAAALVVIWWNWEGDNKQLFRVYFAGAFLCCAGLVVVACGAFFRPEGSQGGLQPGPLTRKIFAFVDGR